MIYSGKHAESYDLFYQGKAYREEAEYASGLIKARCPDARTLFDLGCGTGMRTLEFARLKYDVCGVDQSSSMLASACQHLTEASDIYPANVQFQIGDITTFQAQSRRDAIVSLFHVFSYLTTVEALNQAVACAFSNLTAGGVLLFDYWHGPGVLNDPPEVRTKTVENADLRVERMTVPQHLANEHLVKLTVSLRVIKTGVFPQESQELYTMRYWFPEELEEAFMRAGFHDVSHYSWMGHSAPEPESWQACTVAVKPAYR
jgi:SAM-dependent methyltransferase